MKKILIVNNNLDMGGIQKSLINLLREIHGDYDVTLLLFSQSGSLLKEVPGGVKVISPRSIYSILGESKSELKKHPFRFVVKAFLLKYALIFSRRCAMRLLGVFQTKITGYDVIISYSHLPNNKYFNNGCGDFVLDHTICQNKVCLIHCDYLNSNYMSEINNQEYKEFDKIACCSDSVKEKFIQGAKIDSRKVHTLYNFYDLNVYELAKHEPYRYAERYVNLLSVVRLSPEKGIERAIKVLRRSKRQDIRYYIVGDGPQKEALKELVSRCGMNDQIFFEGEQENPYRYMANADYLLVPSFHEAAPMVYDEAKMLGLRIITTRTTSADEMVGSQFGVVCENTEEGLYEVISSLRKPADNTKVTTKFTNEMQLKQLRELLDGDDSRESV